jgi:hypothetical protein
MLALSHNDLTGSIPQKISALTGLTFLELGVNHLNGTIPPQISALTGLTENFGLVHNSLTGPVPALPFKQYSGWCALQNAINPTNRFDCPLPPVSIHITSMRV